MRWLLGYITALCVLVLIVCEAIIIPAFFTPFYSYEYDKNKTPDRISVEKDELMRVTGELLAYMSGKREDLNVPATVNGENREFFNSREKDHMKDVRVLFDRLFSARNITFWILILSMLLMALLKYKIPYVLSRCLRQVIAGFLVLCAVLAVIIALDFNRAFTVFHLLFFNNDLWILNPATDLLVNIVPLPFFTDTAAFIGALFLLISAVVVVGASVVLRRARVRTRYRSGHLTS